MSVKICKLLLTMTLLSPFGCIASMAQGHFDGPKKAQEQGDTLTTTLYNNQPAYQQDSLNTMLVPKTQKHKDKYITANTGNYHWYMVVLWVVSTPCNGTI